MRRLLPMTALVCAIPMLPALADDDWNCFQQKDAQLRITGCSELIQRTPNDATAYHNRAVAYALSGDLDRAIADYTKAIELDPHSATAYDNRGRAYAAKGDYTRAVADVTKANELIAEATARSAMVATKAQEPPKGAAIPVKAKTNAVARKPASPNNYVVKKATDDWPAWAKLRENGVE